MQVSSLFQGITLFKKVRCQIQYFEHSIEYWQEKKTGPSPPDIRSTFQKKNRVKAYAGQSRANLLKQNLNIGPTAPEFYFALTSKKQQAKNPVNQKNISAANSAVKTIENNISDIHS